MILLITLAIGIIPLFFLWTLVHEGAHAWQVKRLKGKIISFKPYPHKTPKGFYFGRVEWEGDFNVNEKDEILIMPYKVDNFALSLIILLTIITYVSIPSLIATNLILSFLLLLTLGPYLNSGNALVGFIRKKNGDLRELGNKNGLFFPISATLDGLLLIIWLLILIF